MFDDENIKWLDMNVPRMFRYTWYGSLDKIDNNTKIDMERVNRAWLNCEGDHSKFVPAV